MIKFENQDIVGWESAIRGMRNPMNSWDTSDSDYRRILGQKCEECGKYELSDDSCDNCEVDAEFHRIIRELGNVNFDSFAVGPNDLDLMLRLVKVGSVDAKFRRMITVYVDITAPLYWWKEFDTYKVGTVANSCSTMHKIHAKEFTRDDFSYEHLFDFMVGDVEFLPIEILDNTITCLNMCRERYLVALKTEEETGFSAKDIWWQMIQLLPSSYNQKRTVMLNYEVLANIYQHRRNHKLDEWRDLCKWIEQLPYSEIITTKTEVQNDA